MSPRAGVEWTRARWETEDVVVAAGVRVTSPVRTALDLARTRPLAHGVVALDYVIARGADRSRLIEWTLRHPAVRGIQSLRQALDIARGRSESPLESLSLARFAELGVPTPVQQHVLRASDREYRVDFYWPDAGIVGEADGRAKYADADDLWREKRREDAIRGTGVGIV